MRRWDGDKGEIGEGREWGAERQRCNIGYGEDFEDDMNNNPICCQRRLSQKTICLKPGTSTLKHFYGRN